MVVEASALSDEELGEFLRAKGLHEAQLEEWREAVMDALSARRRQRPKTSPEEERICALEKELTRKDKALAEAAALIVLKKSPGDLGGRGRRHGPEERQVILDLLEEAVHAGARLERACGMLGLSLRTVQHWQRRGGGEDLRCGPKSEPANKLSDAEKRQIVATANSPEYRDLSPKQIVVRLADQGVYIASEASFYRTLHEHALVRHRGRARPATAHRPSEHVATGPWQVASWDITYLKTHVAGRFLYLYLVVDIWSRKILGWQVHENESKELAAALLRGIAAANPGKTMR